MTIAARQLLASLVVTAALAAGTAQAVAPADPGWYVGASAGRAEYDFGGGATQDEDGYAVHGGYRITRHVALEAGYAELGDASFQYDCPTGLACVPETYPIVIDQSFSRVDLALLGILPVGERFELFAKVGFAQAKVDQSARYGISLRTDNSTDRSLETVLGVGGRLHFNAPWSLRLQFDRSGMSGPELDSYWLGVEYRFAR